ncbi:serine/threonine protein phosphatase 1 [Rhodoblastus sphagnicola]|uniref:metallophosphoesterase family protein n=1 Tax=Rhodoblastus sphagnicola TaxID=333368 RepID=UPI001615DFD3|nr:metallophosphoesterase family protein [Rhodoblastus sphagnicola]MBB4200571.1 serine/threonine protein phosphatase 1 [Rhodoblastus sphagnicola]
MIFRFLKQKRMAVEDAADHEAPSIPANLRIYAIGDIHGRADLLAKMAELIRSDIADAPLQALTVLLGDYVDRGLQSSQVMEWLATGAFPTPFVALKGNHEETMAKALDEPELIGSWRQYGGLETLMSYGVDVSLVMKGQGYDRASVDFARKLPATHLKLIEAMPTSYVVGDYFFCHAGIRPKLGLKAQEDRDLLWIREEFLNSDAPHEKIIVHGHTPAPNIEIKHNRINLDTGAYMSGKLSCLVLEGDQRRVLST